MSKGSNANDFRPGLGNSRSPCPALNTLANHGYISRTGTQLTFYEIIQAIHLVYNISYPLAIFLTMVGFITCGQISFSQPQSFRGYDQKRNWLYNIILMLISITTVVVPSWSLDLSALSARGTCKITHDASFVHPDGIPSTSPDPQMLDSLVEFASETRDHHGKQLFGLSIIDFVRYHAQREKATSKLYNIHQQVALGECALTWLVLRGASPVKNAPEYFDNVIPTERLRQWLGEERLPDGWWEAHGIRPSRAIGLWRARHVANLIEQLSETDI